MIELTVDRVWEVEMGGIRVTRRVVMTGQTKKIKYRFVNNKLNKMKSEAQVEGPS